MEWTSIINCAFIDNAEVDAVEEESDSDSVAVVGQLII